MSESTSQKAREKVTMGIRVGIAQSISILVLVASAVAAQVAQPGATVAKAHIEGVVLDGLTGMAIADAVITGPGIALPTSTGQVTDSGGVRSNAEGRFSSEVDSGLVTVNFSKTGYRPARLSGRLLNNPGIPINLLPGQQQTGITVRLFPPAVVTGKVFDDRGQPVQDAETQLFTYIYNEAGVRLRSNILSSAKTNDLGDFRMENLDSGNYYLEVRSTNPDGTSPLLAPVFYPGTAEISKAEPITVEPGARLRLNSITTIPVLGGKLKVKLSNQGDEPRGASILSVYRDGDTSVSLRSQIIQKDRMTELVDFGRLAPGRYFIRAGFTGITGGTNEGRITIDMGESDAQIDLPIVTFKPWMFSGRAVFESPNGDSRPVPEIQLALYEVGPNALGSSFASATLTLTTQTDGTFPLRELKPLMPPYAFHVRVLNPPPGMYVTEIRGGTGPREIAAKYGETTMLTVVFGERSGTVEGIITDQEGAAVPAGNVVLLPDNPNEINHLVTLVTGADGGFRTEAAPGTYRLYSWRRLLGAPYLNSEYIREYHDKGLPVRVEQNGQVTLKAKIVDE